MEMLQQQILADEHGLDFKAFIPRPKVPQMLKGGPITSLSKQDILSFDINRMAYNSARSQG